MGTGTVLCMRAHHALPHGQRESKNPVDSTGVQKGRQSIMTKCNHNSDMGNKGGSFPYKKSCAVQEMASLTAEACLPENSKWRDQPKITGATAEILSIRISASRMN